jgi:hypothetical protein
VIDQQDRNQQHQYCQAPPNESRDLLPGTWRSGSGGRGRWILIIRDARGGLFFLGDWNLPSASGIAPNGTARKRLTITLKIAIRPVSARSYLPVAEDSMPQVVTVRSWFGVAKKSSAPRATDFSCHEFASLFAQEGMFLSSCREHRGWNGLVS